MRWLVELTPAAERQFKKLDPQARKAIASGLARLAGEAEAEAIPYTNVRKIEGTGDRWRLRAGDYRAIFTLDERTIETPDLSGGEPREETVGVFVVAKVGHRREVYREQ